MRTLDSVFQMTWDTHHVNDAGSEKEIPDMCSLQRKIRLSSKLRGIFIRLLLLENSEIVDHLDDFAESQLACAKADSRKANSRRST